MTGFMETPVEAARVGVLGIAYDAGNQGVRGTASAPNVLQHYLSFMETFDPRRGDLAEEPVAFLGVISPASYAGLVQEVQEKVNEAREKNPGMRFLFVGGDHTITQVTASVLGAKRILWVDAHPDYYNEMDGEKFAQATSARRLVEQGRQVVMRGTRVFSKEEHNALARDGIDWSSDLDFAGEADYLSLDVDVLDPSLVGTAWPEAPGKPLSRVVNLIRYASFKHADLVEWVPDKGWPQVITLFRELCWRLLGK